MTAEFLLEAIGQIDDDLILDAERPIRRRVPFPRYAAGLAAALALCVGLSGLLFSWRTGSSGNAAGGESNAPSASSPAGGFYPGLEDSTHQESTSPSDTKTDDSQPGVSKPSANGAEFFTERGAYALLRCRIDTLPDGCRALGSLLPATTGAPRYPSTTDPDCVGCPVWESADGTILYLQLSNGNWLAAQLIDSLN